MSDLSIQELIILREGLKAIAFSNEISRKEISFLRIKIDNALDCRK